MVERHLAWGASTGVCPQKFRVRGVLAVTQAEISRMYPPDGDCSWWLELLVGGGAISEQVVRYTAAPGAREKAEVFAHLSGLEALPVDS
jgi:hypothetical protein